MCIQRKYKIRSFILFIIDVKYELEHVWVFSGVDENRLNFYSRRMHLELSAFDLLNRILAGWYEWNKEYAPITPTCCSTKDNLDQSGEPCKVRSWSKFIGSSDWLTMRSCVRGQKFALWLEDELTKSLLLTFADTFWKMIKFSILKGTQSEIREAILGALFLKNV